MNFASWNPGLCSPLDSREAHTIWQDMRWNALSKRVLARRTRVHVFQEKNLVQQSHTRDLRPLLSLAKLNQELETAVETQTAMQLVLDRA